MNAERVGTSQQRVAYKLWLPPWHWQEPLKSGVFVEMEQSGKITGSTADRALCGATKASRQLSIDTGHLIDATASIVPF